MAGLVREMGAVDVTGLQRVRPGSPLSANTDRRRLRRRGPVIGDDRLGRKIGADDQQCFPVGEGAGEPCCFDTRDWHAKQVMWNEGHTASVLGVWRNTSFLSSTISREFQTMDK